MAISKKKRLLVTERAYYCCEYCQCMSEFIPVPFVMEHILPIVKGGTDELGNLAFACHHCNGAKYSKTTIWDEAAQQFIPLFHPRQNNWTTHFKWSDDFMEIISLTPIDRITINALGLNRDKVTNHRRLFCFPKVLKQAF